MKPKTDTERRYNAAKVDLAKAEQDARVAERIVTSHPSKLETLNRRIRDLRNTAFHGTDEQNSRSNRAQKLNDLERDKAKIETELADARAALTDARAAAQTARAEESEAAAAFSIESDRAQLDAATRRTDLAEKGHELAVQGHELQKQKLAQSEQAAADAAKAKLEERRLAGESAERIADKEMKFKAASQRFDWEQRLAETEMNIEARLTEIDRTVAGQLDLAQRQGQVAEQKAAGDHIRNLEVIDANTQADVTRIRTTAEEHRKNVTHEVNEDIRKAFEMLAINAEQAGFETMNAMKLMVLKHQLDKNFETHKAKLAREGRGADVAALAADYLRASNWIDEQQKPD